MTEANENGTKDMPDAKPDLQQEQLAALEKAEKQQFEALAQQREVALETAKYWENVSRQAIAGLQEKTAVLPAAQVNPTLLTEAHFAYLEAVLKAQVEFTCTLLTGSGAR